ncbi:MAG TPA: hypothetical protein VE442_21950, partial [Jatrophihabitans sp.]|nr:hypothetical protein [Jatrophihabitans sp.]
MRGAELGHRVGRLGQLPRIEIVQPGKLVVIAGDHGFGKHAKVARRCLAGQEGTDHGTVAIRTPGDRYLTH